MKLVKLNAIHSTNGFLKELARDTPVENWTVVTTENQTSGKGQFQNQWHSEPGKNLTFSVLCRFDNVKAEEAFYLNCAVSIAIYNALYKYIPEKLEIKWPNDILSYSKKICGILIENVLKNNIISYSIIGIGLNVNQTTFDSTLPNASSMKLIAGNDFDRMLLLQQIVNELKEQITVLEAHRLDIMKHTYEKRLHKMNTPAMFKDNTGTQFMGKIKGVNSQGHLVVELENETIKSFDLKEIKFL